MSLLGNDAGDNLVVFVIKDMGNAVIESRREAGVSRDDFLIRVAGRIRIESEKKILVEHFRYLIQMREKVFFVLIVVADVMRKKILSVLQRLLLGLFLIEKARIEIVS